MDEYLRRQCVMLAANKAMIKDAFPMIADSALLTAALSYTRAGRTPDPQGLKLAQKFLKSRAGFFSVFRTMIQMPFLARMDLSGNPEGYFRRVEQLYNALCGGKRASNVFEASLAIGLTDRLEALDLSEYLSRRTAIVHGMADLHPFMKASYDRIMASISAFVPADPRVIINEVERDYQFLKAGVGSGNSWLGAAHILAQGSTPSEVKCGRFVRIINGIKEAGVFFPPGYAVGVIAGLALLKIPEEEIARKIAECENFLKLQNGLQLNGRVWDHRTLAAAQLVLDRLACIPEDRGALVPGGELAFELSDFLGMIVLAIRSYTKTYP